MFRASVPRVPMLVLAVATTAMACSTDPSSPGTRPASITPQTSLTMTARVATAVTPAPAVLVKDTDGEPVANATVTFAVAEGGGQVSGASARTDANGVATVGGWTLGTTSGAQTLTATVQGLSPVEFVAIATPGDPADMQAAAGANQEGTAGGAVSVLPSARVVDEFGNGVAGVEVTFAVERGGGAITGANATTGADGRATVGSWVLGTIAGGNTLVATSGDMSITFSANGAASAVVTLERNAEPTYDVEVGSAVTQLPSVRAVDANGNGVAGVQITFTVTGGGTLTGATVTTNSGGDAALGGWKLGTVAGIQTVVATFGSLSQTFEVHAISGPPATINVIAGADQTAKAGTALAVAPRVQVHDEYDNPVIGATVTFQVTAGGGTATRTTQETDGDGLATVGSWTLGAVGQNTMTATVAGLPAVTISATAN